MAEVDLERIWLYTLDRWSLAQADSYHRDLASGSGIAIWSRCSRRWPWVVKRGRMVDLRAGYREHASGAHRIYFREEDDRVDIIRILHGRQDIERHLSP